MDSEIEKINVLRLTEDGRESIEDIVVREFPVTIILNNEELVTMLCSPKNLDYLTVGFLFSEGLLESRDEIKNVLVDENRGIVRVNTIEEKDFDNDFMFKRMITSGCGRGASFYHAADAENREQIQSGTKISTGEVLTLMREFQQKSEIFRETGGVHSAALCDTKNILVFMEDIGRHNAIDKIFGKCMMEDIPTEGRIVVTSGRVSSEILLKVSRRNIPIIVSKSAPTNLGVRLAGELGMTLLGFARGKRVNAYTNDWRITD
jgi:FdhD protein